jgi:hypothetical protein
MFVFIFPFLEALHSIPPAMTLQFYASQNGFTVCGAIFCKKATPFARISDPKLAKSRPDVDKRC